MSKRWLVSVGILVAAATAAAPAAPGARVHTGAGWVEGAVTATHRSFLGIPYAAPPVGPLRWRAPRAADRWDGVRDATRPGSPCAQLSGSAEPAGSEDCLYLNVTTPRDATGRLPVLVFLHGGGLISGAGAAYEPERIVDRGAVVVTVNYRLGALGFLRHPAMRDPYAGNFGLADQQAALRWVRNNIAAFGGDHRNVTLWGQSAGGFSVCAQLAAPGGRGLFDKAIVQSAPCGIPMMTEPAADRRGLDLAAALGCADLATAEQCLRSQPIGALVRPSDRDGLFGEVRRHRADVWWFPVAGTPALPGQPLDEIRRGAAARVPLIHGGTRDEMRAHVGQAYDFPGRPVTVAEYPEIVTALFGRADAERILAAYPAAGFASPSIALATLLGDYGGVAGTCTQLPAIDAAVRHAPVYAYEYAQPAEPVGDFPLGAAHGTDLRYFLDSEHQGGPPPAPFTPPEQAFADRLIGYWTAFARTGSPGPDWPAYRRGTSAALSVAIAGTGPVDLAGAHRCGFWHTVP
jgi:para-nitrobenzyl esterase